MQRKILTCALLVMILAIAGCSLPGRIAGILTNADSNAWVKMGQCSGHPWGGHGATVCPVSRKGSDIANMLVIMNERPKQREAIMKTVTGGAFRMVAVIRHNPDDRADIESFQDNLMARMKTDDYLVPTTLNGNRN